MEENMIILEEWEKTISGYKHLRFKEAKELYIKIINANSNIKKSRYMNDLIKGMMFLIPLVIKDTALMYIKSSNYDMNDIINICNEELIKKIKSGCLLNVDYYGMIFHGDFFKNVSRNLCLNYYSDLIKNEPYFKNYYEYVCLYKIIKPQKPDITYIELYNYLVDSYKLFNRNISINDTKKLYDIFEIINISLDLEDINAFLHLSHFHDLKTALICNAFEHLRGNINVQGYYEFEDRIINNLSIEDFFNNLSKNKLLNEREKEVLIRRFRFIDGKKETLKKIGKDYNVTRESIRLTENRAIKKIKKYGLL